MSETLHRVMADSGRMAKEAGAHLHKTQLLEFYRLMVLARELDRAKKSLHRDGNIGFHVSTRGSESIAIGAACALSPEDWIFPSWQFADVAIARDISLEAIFDNLFGNERDKSCGRQGPGSMGFAEENIVSVSSTVGTHIAQAVGMAQGARIKNRDHVALCLFGAGAYESPDFHSGLNFAGVMNAPVVFLTTGETKVAQAYGINSMDVDGTDVMAVYTVVAAACARCRSGKGPTIVHAHTNNADGGFKRFSTWLQDAGIVDSSLKASIAASARHTIRGALENSASIGFPDQDSLFEDVLSDKGNGLSRAAHAMESFGSEYGGSQDPDADFILG